MTNYQVKLHKVLDYIHQHLDEELSVEQLSQVACFSKFHFHRQFANYFKLNVKHYIQQLRIRRASYQLAFRQDMALIDIAFEAGFVNQESFSRAFSKIIRQTPSEFRRKPLWQPWLDKYQWLNELRQNEMQNKPQEKLVQLVEFPETKLAVLEHKGSPNAVMNSVQQFIQWRKQVKCHPSKHATYNIIYDDPALVAADDYRFDIAAAYDRDIVANEFGVIAKTIPSGLCAMLRHKGSDLTLGESIGYLYGQWLVESGYELRDFPCFLHRVTMFPDVSEQEMIIEIYLPIKG